MPRRIVEKRLVCSECGRPLMSERVPAALVDASVVPPDDDMEDDIVLDDADVSVDAVIERGPTCARCAEYR